MNPTSHTAQNTLQPQSGHTFSAKEKDDETGYSYFGARYYDSDLSVWLSVDPMSDQRPSTSPYAYCQNNPIMLVDPNGLLDDWVEGADGIKTYDQNVTYENDPDLLGRKYIGKTADGFTKNGTYWSGNEAGEKTYFLNPVDIVSQRNKSVSSTDMTMFYTESGDFLYATSFGSQKALYTIPNNKISDFKNEISMVNNFWNQRRPNLGDPMASFEYYEKLAQKYSNAKYDVLDVGSENILASRVVPWYIYALTAATISGEGYIYNGGRNGQIPIYSEYGVKNYWNDKYFSVKKFRNAR